MCTILTLKDHLSKKESKHNIFNITIKIVMVLYNILEKLTTKLGNNSSKLKISCLNLKKPTLALLYFCTKPTPGIWFPTFLEPSYITCSVHITVVHFIRPFN